MGRPKTGVFKLRRSHISSTRSYEHKPKVDRDLYQDCHQDLPTRKQPGGHQRNESTSGWRRGRWLVLATGIPESPLIPLAQVRQGLTRTSLPGSLELLTSPGQKPQTADNASDGKGVRSHFRYHEITLRPTLRSPAGSIWQYIDTSLKSMMEPRI